MSLVSATTEALPLLLRVVPQSLCGAPHLPMNHTLCRTWHNASPRCGVTGFSFRRFSPLALIVPNPMFAFPFDGELLPFTVHEDSLLLLELSPRRKPRTARNVQMWPPFWSCSITGHFLNPHACATTITSFAMLAQASGFSFLSLLRTTCRLCWAACLQHARFRLRFRSAPKCTFWRGYGYGSRHTVPNPTYAFPFDGE